MARGFRQSRRAPPGGRRGPPQAHKGVVGQWTQRDLQPSNGRARAWARKAIDGELEDIELVTGKSPSRGKVVVVREPLEFRKERDFVDSDENWSKPGVCAGYDTRSLAQTQSKGVLAQTQVAASPPREAPWLRRPPRPARREPGLRVSHERRRRPRGRRRRPRASDDPAPDWRSLLHAPRSRGDPGAARGGP